MYFNYYVAIALDISQSLQIDNIYNYHQRVLVYSLIDIQNLCKLFSFKLINSSINESMLQNFTITLR